MFESDEYDQMMSEFEFPDLITPVEKENECVKSKDTNVFKTSTTNTLINNKIETSKDVNLEFKKPSLDNNSNSNIILPKHMKRKIIDSYFDHKTKRKFPGPAGILTGNLEEPKDDNICQIELLSQDVDFSQNNLQKGLFESPLWSRLQNDLKEWNIITIDSIKDIKQPAVVGSIRKRKAQTVTAFVEAVDRSVIDPLVILRDTTGSISCTLHRDLWPKFSHYIVAEYCALVLWKPTVLTTGSAFKKHYLNITQNNLFGIYSSAPVKNEENELALPDGYNLIHDGEFTVIKAQMIVDNKDATNQINAIEFTNNINTNDIDTLFRDDF